jgi:tRNA (adenine22-N1)-methyltransferase
VYLVQQGIIGRAVGIEVNEGPYQSALETVWTYGLGDFIDIRKGNGLKPLQPNEVNVLVLAGMGGNTILEILSERMEVLSGVDELVLQPQGAESKVRKELLERDWKLNGELLVEEDGRIYTVIHFTRTEGTNRQEVEQQITRMQHQVGITLTCYPDGFQKLNGDFSLTEVIGKYVWTFGPQILQDPNPLLKSLMEDNIRRMEKIAEEMQQAKSTEVKDKAEEVLFEKKVLEVIKQWLYPSDR